eukprot:g33215.t1
MGDPSLSLEPWLGQISGESWCRHVMSTPEEPEWPEVADNAEKQALQMIERLSRDASSPSCDMRIKPYHVPEPPSAGLRPWNKARVQ